MNDTDAAGQLYRRMDDSSAAGQLYRRYQRYTRQTYYARGALHGARQAVSTARATPGWHQVPEAVKDALDGYVGRVAENHAAAATAEREAWQTYTDAQAEATP
ncbi:MAG: hypothetical protein J2P25_06790 [Nocardiopsaceae bacterium]|nr:hypothetical protein [Nocardiopsaceae bacterium]